MIKIDISEDNKKEIIERHIKDCEASLKEWFTVNNIENEINIKEILTGDYDVLMKCINHFGDWSSCNLEEKRQPYTNFRNRNWAYELLELLDVKVCPYCNRQYTFTVHKVKVSPQFDHYFPISKYPYLQLSLFNLIPSCSTCNLKKSDWDPFQSDEIDILNPYIQGVEDDIYFETELNEDLDFRYWIGYDVDFKIRLKLREGSEMFKEQNGMNEIFKLEDVYQHHSDYISDVIKKMVIYNKSNAKDLIQSFPELFSNENEVLDNYFMNYLKKEEWGKRTLAKLTHDIYQEFKE